jgi:hypothetical protein
MEKFVIDIIDDVLICCLFANRFKLFIRLKLGYNHLENNIKNNGLFKKS